MILYTTDHEAGKIPEGAQIYSAVSWDEMIDAMQERVPSAVEEAEQGFFGVCWLSAAIRSRMNASRSLRFMSR